MVITILVLIIIIESVYIAFLWMQCNLAEKIARLNFNIYKSYVEYKELATKTQSI